MATGTLSSSRPLSTGQVLSALGAVTAGFSLVASLLVLFVIPGSCSFLGGLELVMLAALLLAGVIVLLVGRIISHRTGDLK